MCVQVVPDSTTCAKCGLGPILDKDWRAHLKACQGIDLPESPRLSFSGVSFDASNGGTGSVTTTTADGATVGVSTGIRFYPHLPCVTRPNCAPVYKSSQCPTCTPRCPHGYPADQPVAVPPIITWGPWYPCTTGPYTFGPVTVVSAGANS